jgi:hypothetical protein
MIPTMSFQVLNYMDILVGAASIDATPVSAWGRKGNKMILGYSQDGEHERS